MTNDQKQKILTLKDKGNGYRKIAVLLSLPENSVKSFLRREYKQSEKTGLCRNCNKELEIIPKHKAKIFCCDKCRITFWRKSKKEGKIYENKWR
mgnify:CR=1 FL=1